MAKKRFDELVEEAVAFAKLGKHTQAIQRYEKALKLEPLHQPCLANIIHSLNQTKDYTTAIEFADRILSLGPKKTIGDTYSVTCLNKAISLAHLNLLPEAIELFYAAVEAKPDSQKYWHNLTVALHDAGRFVEEIEALDKILERWQELPAALFRKANVLCNELDSHRKAIICFNLYYIDSIIN